MFEPSAASSCAGFVLISTVCSLQQFPVVSARWRVCCARCLGSVPVSSLALEPLVLLWQEPRASRRRLTRSDRCLKSGTAHGFAAASLRGATTPDLTETCASVCANHFSAVSVLCPSLPSSSMPVNSNTRRSPPTRVGWDPPRGPSVLGSPSLPPHQLPFPSWSLQKGALSPVLPLGADQAWQSLGSWTLPGQQECGSGLVEY